MNQSNSTDRVLISFDYALKYLLRNKVNYEVLEGFLSELLRHDVVVKNIGESETNKLHSTDRHNKVDIFVEDETGEILLIELQFTPEMDFLLRMLYGTSKTITEHMRQGSKYMEVKKVYSINIVYFDLGLGKDYIYHGKTRFTGLHEQDELCLSKYQRTILNKETAGDLYPEYYILKVNNFDDTPKDLLDEWVYFLKHNIIKDEFQAKGLNKAREVLLRDKLPPNERQAYDDLFWARSEELSALATSRFEGELDGLEKGREEGIIEREKLANEFEQEREELANEFEQDREKLARENAILLEEIARLKQNIQK